MRRLGYAFAVLAVTVMVAVVGARALAAGGLTDVTFNGCLAGGKLTGVQATRTPSCAATATPVQWAGKAGVTASPSPTITSPSPSPSVSTSTSAPPPGTCVTSDPSGNCGPYSYAGITNSNGFNTYVSNNCWGDPSCQQTVTATDPGNWSVTAHEPDGNTAVMTYPDVKQMFNDWCGTGWNDCANMTDTPLSAMSLLTSSFTENMHQASGTIAEAGYDLWLTGTSGYGEVMVWVDNSNRGTGGATILGTANIGGQSYTVMHFGSGELIYSLDSNEQSGTVDIRAVLQNAVNNGYESPGLSLAELDFGWEICSTGGQAQTFTIGSYSITAAN